MMTRRELSDKELDTLFEAARQEDVTPDLTFMETLAAQAEAAVQPRTVVRISRWRRLRDAVGGWQGMGGLALATCAGFWIGSNPPSLLPDPAGYLLSNAQTGMYETIMLNPAPVWDEEEG